MDGYPIFLNLTGRRALVVGLGSTGQRKACGLVKAGAQVRGIDRKVISVDVPGIEVCCEPYRAEHLSDIHLAFAAATHEVNRQVVADARKEGIWVNSATEPEEGDFLVPATWSEGPLTLAVSTGGGSPALAAALRDRAAAALGPAAAGLAALLAELRPEVLARVADPEARRRLLADWGDLRHLIAWQTEGPEAVRRGLRRDLEDLCG
jgi:siroheme synthase-like protein